MTRWRGRRCAGWWLLLLASLLAASCSRGPKVDRLDSDAVILAFGDSLTFGTGAGRGESYPAWLEKRIGRRVVNAGVPGETSEQGVARLPRALAEAKPKLLILCHGGNDYLRRLDEARAADNLRAMIRLAREQDIAVVLMATPKPGLPPSVPAFYAEIAREFGVPYEESAIRSVILDNRLKSDMVHPNAKGYEEIARALEKVLRGAGAV